MPVSCLSSVNLFSTGYDDYKKHAYSVVGGGGILPSFLFTINCACIEKNYEYTSINRLLLRDKNNFYFYRKYFLGYDEPE
jgi:hypothetical protein